MSFFPGYDKVWERLDDVLFCVESLNVGFLRSILHYGNSI